MRKHTCIALCSITALVSTSVTAWSATNSGPRYTIRERIKLQSHACKEDEYLFIPSKRVNDHVNYNTPDTPLCVNIENTRKAN